MTKNHYTINIRPILILLLLAILCVAGPLHAASKTHTTVKRYNLARARYNAIKFSKQLSTQHKWRSTARAFIRAYKTDTYSNRAPACLITLGHIYYKIYKRFGKPTDLHESLSYYDDVVSLFPKHPYADDALYHTARIYALEQGHYKDAALVLARLLAIYPNGDMLKKAARDLQRWKIAQAQAKITKKIPPPPKRQNTPANIPKEKPNAANLAQMINLRHWTTKNYTRVVIETSKPINYKGVLIKQDGIKLRRLYINLDNCQVTKNMQKTIPIKNGLLKRVRSAQFEPTVGRVVLDAVNISDYKIFNLDKPFRIVIDVKGNGTKEEKPPKIYIPNTPTLAQQLGLGIKRIILDPGHGGKDPGAIGSGGLREKDVVLKVTKMVARKLTKELGCQVILTRKRDVFIPLEERTAIANTDDGDLFVSIHANAAKSPQAHGIETYYLDLTSNKEDMQLAASENSTSSHNISDLQKMLSSLMNNSKKQESARLAKIVNKTLLMGMEKKYGNIKNHGIKKAPFVVLIGAQMPSILTEIGFISNPTDARHLRSNQYLEDIADNLTKGIIKYAMTLTMAKR